MQQVMGGSGRNGALPSGNFKSGADVSGHGSAAASTRIGVAERSNGPGSVSSKPTNAGNSHWNGAEGRAGWHSFGGGSSAGVSGSGSATVRSAEPNSRNTTMDRRAMDRNTMDRNTMDRNTMDRSTMDRSTTDRNDRPGCTKFSQPDRGTTGEGASRRRQLQMGNPLLTPHPSAQNHLPPN